MVKLILPASYTGKENMSKRNHRLCVVQLTERIKPAEGEIHGPDSIWCDVITMVDLGAMVQDTNLEKLVTAAYQIPDEERAPYYITDYQNEGMSKDRFGNLFALADVMEIFHAVMADCKKMVTGESLPTRRVGVALFAIQGVTDNPLYEPLVKKGHIKVLFFRT